MEREKLTERILSPSFEKKRLREMMSNTSRNYDDFLQKEEKKKQDTYKQNLASFKSEKPLRVKGISRLLNN